MKVLVLHNYYQHPGGEDVVFAEECALLESHGHQVVRFTRRNDAISAMGNWQLMRATLWNREVARELRVLIEKERPDLMHCHNTFPLISPAAYSAARAAKVPVVQSLHNYRLFCPSGTLLRNGRTCEDCMGKLVPWPGIVHACYRGARAPSAVVAGMLAMHRVLGTWSRRVHQYVALSDFVRRKCIEGGLPADRVATKPNFLRSDPGIGAGCGGYAMFVGRLCVEKGIDVLLEAWERLAPDVPLKIVGDGPMRERVRAAAGRVPQIQWLGHCSAKEVLSLLGDAALLAVPSVWYEPFGLAVIEAFAKGTPVVASRIGTLAELVEPGRTGLLFEAGNAEDLAAKVRQLMTDSALLARMRRAAREEYESKYTAESNYRTLMAIYEKAGVREREGTSQDKAAYSEHGVRESRPHFRAPERTAVRTGVVRTAPARDEEGGP